VGFFPESYRASASLSSTAQPLSEIPAKGQAVNVFDGAIGFTRMVVFASAGGLAQENPLCDVHSYVT